MKDLGITRKIDELGRVVLPIEVRRALSLAEKDSVGFYLDEKAQTLVLKKVTRRVFAAKLRRTCGHFPMGNIFAPPA